METFELRYFLAVAESENIHRASEKLRVSASSLSKAISRLEEELSAPLFSREGRSIRLTDHGRILQLRAAEIVRLEEDARLQISGHDSRLRVAICGAEILLAEAGTQIAEKIRSRYPAAEFEFLSSNDETTVEKISRGEAHLGLITSHLPKNSGELLSKPIAKSSFQTFVGANHPLHSRGKNKPVPVEELLNHPFASPDQPLLGKTEKDQSLDGWRDDVFERKIGFRVSSLKTLESLVSKGLAVAYLPDYFGKQAGFQVLKVSGCPYTCEQTISLIAKRPHDVSWMRVLF